MLKGGFEVEAFKHILQKGDQGYRGGYAILSATSPRHRFGYPCTRPVKNVFVCDLGFSSAKCVYGDQKFRVMSAFRESGGKITLGDDALRGVGASYLKTPEDLVRRYPVFLQHCMQKAGVERPVPVAVGVPFGFWVDQSAMPDGGLLGTIRSGLMQLDNVLHAGIYPQGLGGIRTFVDNSTNVTGNVLAIDIGFNTVIYNLWDSDQQTLIYGNTLYKRGMTQMVMEHLKPRIAHYTPRYSYSPIEVCVLLEDGSIQWGMEQVDIEPEISQSTVEYMERIIDDINGELRGQAGPKSRFNTLLVFGGGAYYLKEGFAQKANKQMIVHMLEDPEYANSFGFVSLMSEDIKLSAQASCSP